MTTVIATAFLLAASFGCILGLKYLNVRGVKREQYLTDQYVNSLGITNINKVSGTPLLVLTLISVAVSLIILVINVLLVILLEYLSKLELRTSKTDYNRSFMWKSSIAQFVNSCVIIFITHYILDTNHAVIWLPGGLLSDVFFILAGGIFLKALLLYFDFTYYFTIFARWRLQNNLSSTQMLQKDANELYEGPDIEAANSFTLLIQMFWTSLFFVPLFPIANIALALGLFFIYWTQKYLLLNRYQRPVMMSSEIAMGSLPLIRFGPFVISVNSIHLARLLLDSVSGQL